MIQRKFTFGKYKDKSVYLIIRNDPSYIDWVTSNVDPARWSLSPAELKLYRKHYERDPGIWQHHMTRGFEKILPGRPADDYIDNYYDEDSDGHLYMGLSEEDWLGHYPGDA